MNHAKYDGKNVGAGRGKDSLLAYDLASGELLDECELASGNGDPHGLFYDGVAFWVSGHGGKRLFAYRLEAGGDGTDALDRNRDEKFPRHGAEPAQQQQPARPLARRRRHVRRR